jgi:hypothetical protein
MLKTKMGVGGEKEEERKEGGKKQRKRKGKKMENMYSSVTV